MRIASYAARGQGGMNMICVGCTQEVPRGRWDKFFCTTPCRRKYYWRTNSAWRDRRSAGATERIRAWRASNRRQAYTTNRDRKRLARYGLSPKQYDILLAAQNDCCALCDSPPRHIDHDHETGYVRGLLCHSHNLEMAVIDKGDEYLERLRRYRDSPVARSVISQ